MIIRTIFWFSLVVMLVPVKNDRLNLQRDTGSDLQTFAFIQAVASDVGDFCIRNPDSCETAIGLMKQYGGRVQAHVVNLSDMLTAVPPPAGDEQIITGSINPRQ
ncbi:MAG: DUF5330 domain-containing protein [Rhizobiaceae bacterium]|nr:DUF5330 domain-containing protein [Rhizobiaceae bacterium]